MVVPSLMVAAIVAWVLWDDRTWRKCETCGIKFKSYSVPAIRNIVGPREEMGRWWFVALINVVLVIMLQSRQKLLHVKQSKQLALKNWKRKQTIRMSMFVKGLRLGKLPGFEDLAKYRSTKIGL